MDLETLMSYPIGDNLVRDYALAIGAALIAVALLRLFRHVVIGRLKELSKKTKTDLDDLLIGIIERIGWPFYFLLALFAGIHFIRVPESVTAGSNYLMFLVVVFYAVRSIQQLLDYLTHKMEQKRTEEEKDADTSLIRLMNGFLKWTLWLIAALLIASNLGFDVTALMAGLGIGGIAIAFALQNVLIDVFASFSIFFDKPFKKGDFIVVGQEMGTITKIGIKSTRLEALQGEEVVISNRELTESRIHNFKKMSKRRIVFEVAVAYGTPLSKLKEIPANITRIIKDAELADPDRVHLKSFGDSSLVFEVVYYLKTGDYNQYMDTQQEINLGILKLFEKEGIEIAYPTRTLHIVDPEKKRK